jgi:hypothetical protein
VPAAGKADLPLLAKVALRTILGFIVGCVLYVAGGYSVELYRRVTLARDLKPVLGGLTPAQVVASCGTPDVTTVSDFVLRTEYYRRSGIEIRFVRSGTGERDWIFSSLKPKDWVVGGDPARKDPRWLLESMPCLNAAIRVF